MAEKTIRCRLVTRQERVLDAEVRHASVPLWDGKVGFISRSAPLVGKIGPGRLRVDLPQGEAKQWFVDGGFVQCVDNAVTVLVGEATPVDELDEAEARAELAEANARRSENTPEMDRISAERERARAKLAVIHGM